MKTFGTFLLGLVVGCAVGGGYMYTQLQGAREKVAVAEASRDALSKHTKAQEDQLKQAVAAKSTLEAALKDTKDQLGSSKQANEQALKELPDYPDVSAMLPQTPAMTRDQRNRGGGRWRATRCNSRRA